MFVDRIAYYYENSPVSPSQFDILFENTIAINYCISE